MLLNDSQVDNDLLGTWIKGWSLAREVMLPVSAYGGFRVAVGWPEQKERYVFTAITEGFRHVADTITEPYVFLKVCLPPEKVRPVLPPRWVIQQERFLMICSGPMTATKVILAKEYMLDIEEALPVPVVRVLDSQGTQVSAGRVAFADNHAIYDRIETHPDHRRKGLAAVVMKTLEAIAAGRGISKGILVATAEGRALYEPLGWNMLSPYTTAVIPGAGEKLTIEKAKAAQLDTIFDIFTACKRAMEEERIFQWTEQYPAIGHIAADIESGYLYSLNSDGKSVGVINVSPVEEPEYKAIAWEDKEGRILVIHRLAVHPSEQKKGYARKLMDFAEDHARQQGYTSIRLDAYSGNPRVLRFYERRGYEKRGETYFPGRALPFYCYEKNIAIK